VFEWARTNALEYAKKKDNDVTVYVVNGELFAFSGLGRTNWLWPDENGEKVRHSHLAYAGIDLRYRGLPDGPQKQRYSWLILDDIVGSASKRADRKRLLSLYVHVENARAIALYRAYGFEDLPYQIIRDEQTGAPKYQGMILSF
jgi:ribosomal protein S18 acetylase RimI-like enzyme